MERSWLKNAFVAFVVLVGGWHAVAVTGASLPPNGFTTAVEPMTDYQAPFFTQNWRLFAPNPIGDDRIVRFQGAYRDESGTVEQTEWVDWSPVELDVVRHRLIGGRAGYVSSKLVEALSSSWRPLGEESRRVATEGTDTEPRDWAALNDAMLQSGAGPDTAARYVRHERAVAGLATAVLLARQPELELVSVRYVIAIRPVVPYALRGTDAERPPGSDRMSGWRVPETGSAAELASVADFDERHR